MVFFYNQGLTSLSSLATYAIVPGSLATVSLYQTALFEAIFTGDRIAQKSADVKIKEKSLGLLSWDSKHIFPCIILLKEIKLKEHRFITGMKI